MVEAFASDHDGRWPASMDELLKKELGSRPYMAQLLPRDPWHNPYVLEPSLTPNGRPRILTLGKDARPGGDGDDADFDDGMFVVSSSEDAEVTAR